MANGLFVAAIIFSVLAITLIFIAVVIIWVISGKVVPSLQSKLRIDTAFAGFTGISAIITSIFGILLARSYSNVSKGSKGLLVAFIIAIVITLILYVVVIVLTVMARGDATLNSTDKNALTASIILMAFGFVSMAVGAIMFFSLTKGKKGKEAIATLKYSRSPSRSTSVKSK